ncbi:patatin-like phospholipase family protein [Parasphingopyxis marina]|uniref:Patatin-like phospholipase family protein n=1 Tax=Parasphingopyxis marina TaxID=2761622 RepID=A0A842HRD1_9SPHN|nr:patatin-like phospholipase family protein [Parasphingopyxis marina]MBC2776348.1 patatin-like phospholipase family protein [Parasphingopyxis marina]
MKIALALGGGAGLGWAHIGVLRALEEAEIEVGALAGTSIGGIVAIAHAAGRLDTLEELAHSASSVRAVLRYLGPNWRPGSVLSGKAIAKLIEEHLGDLSFDTLSIPTAVVAADLISGDPVVLDSGPVCDAIHATIALPGIFQPVVRDGQVLSDGGAVMPVPVRPARDLGPGLPVIAINLQGDYGARRAAVGLADGEAPRVTTLSIVRSATGLMLSNLARLSIDRDPPDFELALPVGHIDVSNFTRAEELIGIGRRAVSDSLEDIEALANI